MQKTNLGGKMRHKEFYIASGGGNFYKVVSNAKSNIFHKIPL